MLQAMITFYTKSENLKNTTIKNSSPVGSMGPKIKSAINFIEGRGKKVRITKAELYYETLMGNAGTTIINSK